jgi:hypothetical protein
MSPTDQIQDLFDRAFSSVPADTEHSPLALHQRLHRRRLRTRISTLGGGALAVAVSATALLTGFASNSAFAVTLYPGTTDSVAAAQLSADQRVMTARLRAVGFPSASVMVEHGTLVVTNGPRDLANPSSYLTASPELLIRGVTCYAGPQSGPFSTNPLPATCSGPQYKAPIATPDGTSSPTGFTEPNVQSDPALTGYATTTSAQDAASPNAYALLPTLNSTGSSVTQRFLVGPTLLALSSKVASVTVVPASIGGWMINVRLDPSESRLWDQVAAEYFHRELAIDLNGVVDEAPVIQPGSTSFNSFDGQMQLYATTKTVAYDLAAALTTGPLAAPLVAHKYQNKELQLPNPTVVAASLRLSSVLAKQFSDQFAGITLSNNNSTINVYVTDVHVTKSTSGLTSEVRNLTPRGSVHYVTVVNSWRSLLAVQHQLEVSWSALKTRGIDIADFSTDADSNREVIEVVNLAPAQTAILDRRFGASRITVQGISANQAPVPIASTWGSGTK